MARDHLFTCSRALLMSTSYPTIPFLSSIPLPISKPYIPSFSLFLKFVIMRRNQFSQPNPSDSSPKRRRIESRFFSGSSAQGGVTGSNNQDLISGFQNTQWSNLSAPPFPPRQRSISPLEDEDLELDAFGEYRPRSKRDGY